MKNYRTIYMVEAYSDDYDVIIRRFARNNKVAQKIEAETKKNKKVADVTTRKLNKRDFFCIDMAAVEG